MLMLYNITLVHVLQILRSLTFEIPDTLTIQDLTTQHILQDPRNLVDARGSTEDSYLSAQEAAVLELCRCIPFHLDHALRLGSEPSPILHWAAATAWLKLGGNESAVRRWIMELLVEKNPLIAQVLPILVV
jgi:hypothetical protein